MKKILTVVLLLVISLAQTTYAKNSIEQQCALNGVDLNQAVTFVSNLHAALKTNDKEKIADFIAYPLRVNLTLRNGKNTIRYIKTKKNFFKSYDFLFNTRTKQRLLNESEIFCNYQGAMLSDGLLWFKTDDNRARVITLNINKQ
jgi:hypothetical protein